MNYKEIYNRLIERARNRKLDCYTERHHIIPRCMGGDNHNSNIVNLTPKEHFIGHKLLVEIYPDNGKLIHAYWLMANNKSDDRREYNVSSREYERLKIIHAKWVSINLKGKVKKWKDNKVRSKKIGEFHKGKTVTEEVRNKISNGLKEYYSNNQSASIGRIHSEETRKKMSEKLKGRIHSEETISKIKNTFLDKGISGNPISDTHKENIKKSIKKRKWINNGKVSKKIEVMDVIEDGWVEGRLEWRKKAPI
jgi:hypothetical protein